MCGIAGFIDFRNNSSAEMLCTCTDTLAHRGPDDSSFEFLQNDGFQVGLGHRRLSIIDLSNASSQPMWYKHFCIIFNGEIYNYKEIKEELKALGHTFETHGDTEVILHAYEEWAAAAIDKFIGMFSFAIYDRKADQIFLCRDRPGVKPMFYYWDDSLFIFGSELKSLMKHPRFRKELDVNAVASFMRYGYVPTPHCIFKKAAKLKAGHYLYFNIAEKSVNITEYWNVHNAYNTKAINIGFNDAAIETEKVLTNAFQYRMVSDVPVGVFLSGGYDSSCVTALLQKDSTQKIKTFTIGIADAGLNEAPFAKTIAGHLGTDHTEYYCSSKEALEIVPNLPVYYDEPFADSSAIPTTLVSRIAREKVTVALSADGGDEIFAGYNRYEYMLKYGALIPYLPSVMRRSAHGLMQKISSSSIPVLGKQYLFHSRYEKIKGLLKNATLESFFKEWVQHFDAEGIERLFKQKVTELETAFDKRELEAEYYNTLNYMLAKDYQTYLADDILQKVDRATMSVGLEGREPFLDHRVVEWAGKLPNKFKYHKGNKKIILKEIVHKYIPKEIMDRPKMGFGVPIAHWLQDELKPFVDHFLGETFIKEQNIFNPGEIERLKNSFFGGQVERAEKIWFLLMFQMWFDKWMNNN